MFCGCVLLLLFFVCLIVGLFVVLFVLFVCFVCVLCFVCVVAVVC